jgi:D-alanine-D-alanine ligase
MRIGIIYNSFAHKKMLPEEKELRSTSFTIGRHLVKLGHDIQYYDIDTPESIMELCKSNIDVAFDTCERVHSDPRGEAYTTALLEYLGIRHTRTSSFFIAFGNNKVRVKKILACHNIRIPRFQVFEDAQGELSPDLKFPLFVKGVACENSIGIDEHSFVTDMHQLSKKIAQINTLLNQPALVEEFIDGREFSVAILPGKVNRTLPITEIEFNDLPLNRRYLDYTAKWIAESEKFQKTVPVLPENLTGEEIDDITSTALECFRILSLDSYARIDMRYKDHSLYVLEVNQNPSIDEEGSGYVRACQDMGLDYTGMINALLQNAIQGVQ